MLSRYFSKQQLPFALLAAAAYCITAWFFIRDGLFTETWILYAGNFAFAGVVGIFIILYSWKNKQANVPELIRVANSTVVTGIVTSCIVCFLLLYLLHPSLFKTGHSIQLQHSPVQFNGKHGGFVIILIMDAVLGNICTGLFVTMLLPFMLARRKDDTGKQA